jgi:hypothetical protein
MPHERRSPRSQRPRAADRNNSDIDTKPAEGVMPGERLFDSTFDVRSNASHNE